MRKPYFGQKGSLVWATTYREPFWSKRTILRVLRVRKQRQGLLEVPKLTGYDVLVAGTKLSNSWWWYFVCHFMVVFCHENFHILDIWRAGKAGGSWLPIGPWESVMGDVIRCLGALERESDSSWIKGGLDLAHFFTVYTKTSLIGGSW